MSDAPEKIWAYETPDGDTGWLCDPTHWQATGSTEYVRSDIAEREIAELRAERDSARNDEWLAAISAVQYMEANWFQDCRSEVERSALQSAAEEIISELRRSGPTEYLDLKWKDAKAAVAAESRAETAERQLAERDAELALVREAIERVLSPAPGVRKPEPWVYGILKAALSAQPQPAQADGWREITEEDSPPNDTEVLMGCWESWPEQKWVVEYGLYGSTKGGWIHGRMTHWLPSSFLPAAPTPAPAEGR